MLTLCHAPTETATADAFLATSTRSTPALATFAARVGAWRRRGRRGPRGRRGRRRREKPGRQPFFLDVFLCVREWVWRAVGPPVWIAILSIGLGGSDKELDKCVASDLIGPDGQCV